jgi:hypothetical protein
MIPKDHFITNSNHFRVQKIENVKFLLTFSILDSWEFVLDNDSAKTYISRCQYRIQSAIKNEKFLEISYAERKETDIQHVCKELLIKFKIQFMSVEELSDNNFSHDFAKIFFKCDNVSIFMTKFSILDQNFLPEYYEKLKNIKRILGEKYSVELVVKDFSSLTEINLDFNTCQCDGRYRYIPDFADVYDDFGDDDYLGFQPKKKTKKKKKFFCECFDDDIDFQLFSNFFGEEQLRKCTNLKKITLINNKKINNLSKYMTKLEYIDILNSNVNDKSLMHFRNLTTLHGNKFVKKESFDLKNQLKLKTITHCENITEKETRSIMRTIARNIAKKIQEEDDLPHLSENDSENE